MKSKMYEPVPPSPTIATLLPTSNLDTSFMWYLADSVSGKRRGVPCSAALTAMARSGVASGNAAIGIDTDAAGNASACTGTLTVADQLAPQAVCNNISLVFGSGYTAQTTAAALDGGSTDNCGIDSIWAAPLSYTCAQAGPNAVVPFHAGETLPWKFVGVVRD